MNSVIKKIILPLILLAAVGSVMAQPRYIDRANEKDAYPNLQVAEANQEANVRDVMKRLSDFKNLVEMAREDRITNFNKIKEPNNFQHTLKNITYTPRNTYVRYVREDPESIFVGIGEKDNMLAQAQEKIALANQHKITIKNLEFKQRDGIELTQFEFIRETVGTQCCIAVGSRRKSITLYYRQAAAQQPEAQQELLLDMVVLRVVEDHQRNGVKNVEVIIDPTPLDADMNDIMVFQRYNVHVPHVSILGAMSNTTNYPHRYRFKRSFYNRLNEHFYRLMMLVDNYASKGDNDYNQGLIEEVEKTLDY
jgi:hypothetical protein